MVKRYKDVINFVEPQSMNFEVTINKAYAEFRKQQAEKNPQDPRKLITATNEDKVNEAFDDQLFSVSKAKKQINKKKKDQGFFKKLQKECELYYKEN